jgi:hypothetical protein
MNAADTHTDNGKMHTSATANATTTTPEMNHGNNNSNQTRRCITNAHANMILEHYGQWLLSIPRDDVASLMETTEYQVFIQAFQSLEKAHREIILQKNQRQYELNFDHEQNHRNAHNAHGEQRNDGKRTDISTNQNTKMMKNTDSNCCTDQDDNNATKTRKNTMNSALSKREDETQLFSFLQHLVLDDILLRIFEFLPCTTLIKTSSTCHRFYLLCKKAAYQRTNRMEGRYFYKNAMKLLRAKEQIQGIKPHLKPVVRVPLLGLPKRLYVSGCGDKEFNGIYFCTGSNGNGYLFTKPRHSSSNRRSRSNSPCNNTTSSINIIVGGVDIEDNNIEDVDGVNENDSTNNDMDVDEQFHAFHHNHHHHQYGIDHGIDHGIDRGDNPLLGIMGARRDHAPTRMNQLHEDGEEAFFNSTSTPRCIISKRFSREVSL